MIAVRPINHRTEAPVTEEFPIQQLTAVVNTLISATTALFANHPRQSALQATFARLCEEDVARELAQALPDDALHLAQQLRQVLLSLRSAP